MPKIAIICLMRKGSTRFPGKNIALFFGIPLYLWTINFFKTFNYPFYLLHDYDNLYVPEWVNEIRRITEFTGDIHKTAQEIKWTNIDADVFILLQVTSPFRNHKQIEQAINDFIKNDYDCGLNVKRMPIGLYYNATANEINFKQAERTYNQCNKQLLFKETGSFYIFKKHMLDKKHILDSKNKVLFEDLYNIDIDNEDDLRDIECKLKSF